MVIAKDVKVKILGIVASPIKGGNCQYLAEKALEATQVFSNVETELIHLKDYRIEYCIGCDGCVKRVHKIMVETGLQLPFPDPPVPIPVKRYNCGIKDDMEVLHGKLLDCDGVIFCTPVYMLTPPAQFKVFVDRCRTFAHDLRLWGKPAACLTVATFRSFGQCTTLNMMNLSIGPFGFMIVLPGAGGVSTEEGLGKYIKETRFGVSKDLFAMNVTRMTAVRVAEAARLMKAGRLVLESPKTTAEL